MSYGVISYSMYIYISNNTSVKMNPNSIKII